MTTGDYYHMGYLFDTQFEALDSHTDYWLGQNSVSTTFTIEFTEARELTRIKVAPACRSDSTPMDYVMSVRTSSSSAWVPITPGAHVAHRSAPIGRLYEFPINMEVSAVKVELQKWEGQATYVTFNEIQMFEPAA